MNDQTRAAQGSHNTARLFPNPKISLNAKEIRRLRGLVPPPPPPVPADWAPIDAHNEKKKEKKPYRYKRPKNLDEKGKYVLSDTINCGAVRPISSVRFTPSGRHLALGSADAIGRFCQRRNGKWEVVLLFDEHEEGINDIQFSALAASRRVESRHRFRVHRTMTWVVSFSILSHTGRRTPSYGGRALNGGRCSGPYLRTCGSTRPSRGLVI